jgi:HlyD family secretion protein
VTRDDLEITVSASGNVIANQKADLRFDTPGKVTQVYVEVGDHVQAGQELARLDTGDLERAVRQAEISLEQAKLNLQELLKPTREEDLDLAQLSLNEATQALEVARIGKESAQAEAQEMMRQAQQARDTALNNYNAEKDKPWAEKLRIIYVEAEGQLGITQVNAELKIQQAQDRWLNAYNRYMQAKDTIQKLEEGVDEDQIRQTELQIEQAELNLEKAQEALDKAILKATFSGLVATVNLQKGVQTPTTLPAITIVDDTKFYVDTSIDETDISKIDPNLPVTVTLDAYPDIELQGTVENIAPASVNTGGVIAYPVRVQLKPTEGAEVREGMTASVIVQTSRLEDTLLIPNWAIRTDQTTGETYVYCQCQDNETQSLKRFAIILGERNENLTQVLSGLEEGMTVALVVEERNLLEFTGPPSR